MQHKKSTGRCVGNIAYGYRLAADGEHEPEPTEQTALAQILTLRGQAARCDRSPSHLTGRHCVLGAARAGGATTCFGSSVAAWPPHSAFRSRVITSEYAVIHRLLTLNGCFAKGLLGIRLVHS